MVFKFLWGKGSEHLEGVEAKVQQMMANVRHEFDLAMAALLGDVVGRDVNDELRTTDQHVNMLERQIRRELVVHASVFGGIESPAVLVYMSIVKDIERIGDYAKNILDLSLDGANFGGLPDAGEWRQLAAELSQFIADAAAAFGSRDISHARRLHQRGDKLLDLCDDRVSAMLRADDREAQAVARALAYRYVKRVVAHLMNLLSAVIMPVDRLDFFDEDPEDRLGA